MPGRQEGRKGKRRKGQRRQDSKAKNPTVSPPARAPRPKNKKFLTPQQLLGLEQPI